MGNFDYVTRGIQKDLGNSWCPYVSWENDLYRFLRFACQTRQERSRRRTEIVRDGWNISRSSCWVYKQTLVGGLGHFLFSILYMIILPFDFHIFQDSWNHQPEHHWGVWPCGVSNGLQCDSVIVGRFCSSISMSHSIVSIAMLKY